MITVATAPVGLACDTAAKLNDAAIQALLDYEHEGQKIRGVARYVGISRFNPGDIDVHELERITNAGLGCWLVQHVRATAGQGWTPSDQLGFADGMVATRLAWEAGYPEGAHLTLDLEDVKPGTPSQMVIDYCNAWCQSVADRYDPMLYVGFSTMMTGEQLYEALPYIHLYWSDYGNRYVAERGCAVKQMAPGVTIGGVGYDLDHVGLDMKGGALKWAVASQDAA